MAFPPSALDLPGGHDFTRGRILGVLELNTHGRELVANAVCFGEVLCLPRRQTGADARFDDGREFLTLLFGPLTLALYRLASKAKQRQGVAKGTTFFSIMQPVQLCNGFGRVQIIAQSLNDRLCFLSISVGVFAREREPGVENGKALLQTFDRPVDRLPVMRPEHIEPQRSEE